MAAYNISLTPRFDGVMQQDLRRVNDDRAKRGEPPLTPGRLLEGVIEAWVQAKAMEQQQEVERMIMAAYREAPVGTQQQMLALLGLLPPTGAPTGLPATP